MNTNIKMLLSLAQCSGILHVNLTHYGSCTDTYGTSCNLLFYVVSAMLIYGIGKNIPYGLFACIDDVWAFCNLEEYALFVNIKQGEML